MAPFLARRFDQLAVEIHSNAATLGMAAAQAAITHLRHVLTYQWRARVMFACAPSQDHFLAAFISNATSLDWSRLDIFHMDEYVGLPANHPQSFRSYLRTHLLNHIPADATHHLIEADDPDPAAACARYANALASGPIDLVCMGIGENGHIAFNDPPVADFNDPHLIKKVELDAGCRAQQVNDGCFPTMNDVPRFALTVTIPVFLIARKLSIHVAGPRKARAVRAALTNPVETRCPASILRTHPAATLYLDPSAASLL